MLSEEEKELFDGVVRKSLDMFVLHIIGCDDEQITEFIKHFLVSYDLKLSVINELEDYYKQTSEVYILEKM